MGSGREPGKATAAIYRDSPFNGPLDPSLNMRKSDMKIIRADKIPAGSL
jgi:hypothetical protein